MRILFPEAPAAVAEALLLPGEGKERLSQLAQLCFEATGQEPTMFDLALLGGDPAGAMAMFEASLLARPMPTTLARLGECAFRLDDVELAARRWAELAELQPWRVGWLLRLHDLLCGPPGRRASLPGSVLAMIVSQGGPDMLDRCLERLFAQPDPLLAALVCDNGDASVATALDAWLGRIGPERLQVLRLPVAVGVPAARNWMRRLDSVAAADQVLLFGAAVALRPDAAFHALAATDEGRPGWLAGLGGGILPEVGLTPEGQAATPPAPRFVLDEPWRREPDFGQFDGARPCLAAPGACKLVAGELLRGAPDFDLRFSPTGCEDADRDLAQALAGRVGSCVGLARVALQTGPHPARDAGILAANLHKLQKKIDAAQTLALLERGRAAARADLEGKLARLAQR